MEAVSLCPLRVGSVLWQPRPSVWVLTVVCKATYQLQPGVATLAAEQEAPHDVDNHWDDDAGRSLYVASDLVPVKPRVDVVLVGCAFAPGKLPVRSLVAKLSVGDLDKAIEVFCDRTVSPDGKQHEGQRFARIPLVYERAAGGPDSANPVGVRIDAPDRSGKKILPNLQPSGRRPASPADHLALVGFGPIAPNWPSRRDKLGHLARTWDPESWRNEPLPEGMDLSFFNTAPPDQQMQTLRDDEQIILENLHPDHARLSTRLPGQRPRALIEGAGGATRKLSMRADTLWIDTDRSICTVTWRGQVPLEHPQQAGRVVISLEQAASTQAGRMSVWTRVGAPPIEDLGPDPGSTLLILSAEEENPLQGTLTASLQPMSPVLPFRPQAASPPGQREEGNLAPRSGFPFVSMAETPRGSDSSISWPIPPELAVPRESVPPPVVSSPWGASATAGTTPKLTVGAMAIAMAAEPGPSVRNDGSLLAASNAAAGVALWAKPRSDLSLQDIGAAPDARPLAVLGEGAALHLVWHDTESVARIRRKPEFRQIIKAAEDAPFDPELDDLATAKDAMAIEERREVFEVLARAKAVDDVALHDALASAVRRDGKFVPPLALVEGELFLPFDELDTLKAAVAATTAFASNDERLKGAITDAEAILQKPDLPVAPLVLEVLTARIRDAFASGKRPLSSTDLDVQIERALLSKRRYQRREVFGGLQLRALLSVIGAKVAVPTYLPESLAKRLPMAARFRARLVVELYFAVDQYEASPAALKVLALGWVMTTRQL